MVDESPPTTSLKVIFRQSQLGILLFSIVFVFVLLGMITIWSLNTYTKRNIKTLGETLSELIQPAIVFEDKEYLQNMLQSYVDSYAIQRVKVLNLNGEIIVEKKQENRQYSWLQNELDMYIYNDAFYFHVKDDHDGNKIATLVLYPSSEQISEYLVQVFIALLLCLMLMIGVWLYSIQKIYRSMMRTMQPLIQISQLIKEQKAYNLRFQTSKIYEFNILIQVFNQLLSEIQSWQSDMQQENAKLSYQAHHDELTSLPNRHVFYNALNVMFNDPVARQQSALIFLDNNKFKDINDTFGHQAGDAILKETANRLKSRIRQQDLIVRIGGDEFAIILRSIAKFESLATIAENLTLCCREPLIYNDQPIHFSFSIGVAFSAFADSPEELIKQADQAMYQAKTLESHWSIFSPKK